MRHMSLFAPFAIAFALFAAATPEIVAREGGQRLVGGPLKNETLTYGADPRQQLRLFTRARAGRAPLLVYIHGGGWSAGTPDAGAGPQPEHFTRRGYAWATAGYRFVPGVRVEDQAADLAAAIAAARRTRGVDPDRILLVGHSSGGHLAALLATDPRWLAGAGVPFDALRGVVLLDPAALDVGAILGSGARGGTIDAFFRPAFGEDPARWAALSPLAQAAAPNAPAWLMLHDAGNVLAGVQSQQLARDLEIAGAATVRVQAIPGTNHVRLNDELGGRDDRATAEVDVFLDALFPDMTKPLRR